MTFLPLASSSYGNAYLVSDGETTILLECGLSFKELQKKAGFELSKISACFITHEHQDHSKAAAQLLKRGIPVYMTYGTALAHPDNMDAASIIAVGDIVQVGKLSVKAFATYHNTLEPVGYLILDMRTHEKLLFAIDTANMNYIVPNLDYIALECNYEQAILDRIAAIDKWRKERIKRSHMEVNKAIAYLHKLDLSKCQRLYLMHLSAACSNASTWLARFKREFPGLETVICPE